jgi:hypothetical protein
MNLLETILTSISQRFDLVGHFLGQRHYQHPSANLASQPTQIVGNFSELPDQPWRRRNRRSPDFPAG